LIGLHQPPVKKQVRIKPELCFENNILRTKQTRISRIIDFTRTNDFSKYLGMPLIKGRVTYRTYEDLILKIDINR
jgi:hypothetical protein